MTASVDDRLLARWETSKRHHEEARRFLARQRFTDPRFEKQAVEHVVRTIEQLERELHDRAARKGTRRPPDGSGSA